MRVGSIGFQEILAEGCRLTGGFHLSEDQLAVNRLRQLRSPTERIAELVRGRGVFRGPIFKRIYADGPENGDAYISARDLVMADICPTTFLSRRLGGLLEDLRIEEGMILVTCSGMNLGTAIWARADIAGLVGSHDLIRICPDDNAIQPGYLQAFLASRYGRALIRRQIYGGSIKHIEPEHIGGLSVPRLGSSVEDRAHALVKAAAQLRSSASALLARSVRNLEEAAGLSQLAQPNAPKPYSCAAISASAIQERFDAFFHSPSQTMAVASLRSCAVGTTTVGDLAESIVEPTRFKRVRAADAEHGIKFFGTSALMSSEPVELYFLPKKQPGIDQYLVSQRTVLIPRSGQLSGILGIAVLPYGEVRGCAVSEDAIRVNCRDDDTAGFIYVALTSQYGLRQLKARAYGSSIPHLDVHQIKRVLMPDPGDVCRREIGAAGVEVARLRDEAVAKDRQARSLVEQAIEEGS